MNITLFLRRLYNASFTGEGRRNLRRRWRMCKLVAFSDFLMGDAVLYQLYNGSRFVVHPGDRLSLEIFLDGAYEDLETAFVRAVARPGDVVVDIGANVGYFTALLSRAVSERGRVHAFEPGPSTYSKLRTTVSKLGLLNVETHELAIGDGVGSTHFVASNSGRDAQQSIANWCGLSGDRSVVTVEMTSIDEFLATVKAADEIAFVKCDVEGGEMRVLSGAANLLGGASPPIFMLEANRKALAANGGNLDALAKFLCGYEVFYTPLGSSHTLARPLPSDLGTMPDLANFFAFPKTGPFAKRRYLPEISVLLDR